MAGYDRRLKDWKFQADLARKEIEQLDKQIIAGEIRRQLAEADLENHQEQIARAEEVEEFLKMKFTNQQLYSWMLSKLSSLHFQAYQMAYQMAKQTETAYHHELGAGTSRRHVRPAHELGQPEEGAPVRGAPSARPAAHGAGVSRRQPAGSGDHQTDLALPARRGRVAQATRDRQVRYPHPRTAVRSRLPRPLLPPYQGGPGHDSCVAGPYTNVSATLRLMQSWTRREVPTDLSLAPPDPEPDATVLPQTAIATSTGSGDAGMFELNFRDERYLPFEGAGAIGTWELELLQAIRPFDYDTIADVVIHLSYSARDGGESFKETVNKQLIAALNGPKPLFDPDATMNRLFSLRHDFPDAWSQLVNDAAGEERTSTLQLSKQHFPSFLDYDHGGQTASGETIEPKPIKLGVTKLKAFLSPAFLSPAFLSPHGVVPTDEVDIELNGHQPDTDADLGIPTFELSGDLRGLTSIENNEVVEYDFHIDGVLRPEDWDDLYLLMDYDVSK